MGNIYVFGHRKPDTDSVTSAIALAELKNRQGQLAMPVILDSLNNETAFVLDYFGFEKPKFLNDVKLQIKDIEYHKDCYMSENASIKQGYEYMKDKNITGVPLVDKDKKLLGLVTLKMLGNELVHGNYSYIKTSYSNILDTLFGEELFRFNEEIEGKIVFESDVNIYDEENMIWLSKSVEKFMDVACKKNVKAIVLLDSGDITDKSLELAEKNKINIIKTHLDILHAIKLMPLSSYLSTILSDERVARIEETQYYDEFLELSNSQGYNNYPIVSKDGVCLGLFRVTDSKNKNKKKVILVDHNEASQSVIGLEEAEVLEIVDHHKIGTIATSNPINFRNMTVGSTNTIVYMMYKESKVEIPKKIAGLMLAGIVSDTLCLKSPTTTFLDKVALEELTRIAEVDLKQFSEAMFEAGTSLAGMTKDEILNMDMKEFPLKDYKVAVAQVTTLTPNDVLDIKEEFIAEMENMCTEKGYEYVIFIVTDIRKNGSYILYSNKSTNMITSIFDNTDTFNGFFVENFVSRKKQMMPLIMNYIENN